MLSWTPTGDDHLTYKAVQGDLEYVIEVTRKYTHYDHHVTVYRGGARLIVLYYTRDFNEARAWCEGFASAQLYRSETAHSVA